MSRAFRFHPATIAFVLFAQISGAQRVEITLNPSATKQVTTGRVYVFFAKDSAREPRLLGGSYGGSVPFFGVDVEAMHPGATTAVDGTTLGYPYETLSQMPAGQYYVQALMNIYTKFERADGHVVWVHNDQWEGQHF